MNFKKSVLFCLIFLYPITPILGKNRVITLFSHGVVDTWEQVYKYVKSYTKDDIVYNNDRYLIHTPFVSFNYPDASHTDSISSILRTKSFFIIPSLFYLALNSHSETSFGQENEIGRLYKAYTAAQSYDEDGDIILWGLSRGASNLLIFAGLYELTNVKAIVIESPYHTMGEVIESLMIKKNLTWFDVSYGETIAEFIFKRYNRHGWSPAKCIENIPKDIPIFIICSQEDNLVPASSSINIYKKLIESGHKHTYIFITEHGAHAKILRGPDGEKYQWVVNAFYKKYNLPHCAASAAQGESLLALCQPQFA